MATELAKAYVQIIPSANGIAGSISNVLGGEADNAGKSAGSRIVSNIKNAIITGGLGAALTSSIMEGAKLQQSLGGIETLFKNSADTIKKYATQAYKTAGISANSYMEQATSFSASLLQSLSGDTKKAAEAANQAIIDMADNSNKMGTSLELIQNAYQGFAKQNYTMLDNLKLGYGGTQSEMKRLLADAQKLSGIKYNINNLSDVYNAIHVIQENLGITGTTAQEAMTTFTGSFSAMKSAVSNFLADLSLGENIAYSLTALGETIYTFTFDNLLPMVGNIMIGIGEVIITTDWIDVANTTITKLRDSIYSSAQNILGTDGSIVDATVQAINNNLPKVLNEGVIVVSELINGMLASLPDVISTTNDMLTKFIECIMDNLPVVIEAGVELILNLVQGIVQSIPTIISSSISAVIQMAETILKNAPRLIESGISLIGQLIAGIIEAVPDLLAEIPGIVSDMVDKFKEVDWLQLGKDIIGGIASGISNAGNVIITAAKNAANSALNSIKSFLGIHSPSKVFDTEVGKNISLGLAEGIENNLKPVNEAMTQLGNATMGIINTDMNVSKSINVTPNESQTLQVLMQILNVLSSDNNKMYQIVLDSGTLVGELAPELDVALGDIESYKSRGIR